MIYFGAVMNGFGPASDAELFAEPAEYRRAADLAQVAKRMITQLTRRSAYLPQAVYEDPQWLMILHLFMAAESGARLCVSDLCASSGVPATTALRHIAWLEKNHVVIRSPHPSDARRSFIDLADTAHQQVAGYLRSIATLLE